MAERRKAKGKHLTRVGESAFGAAPTVAGASARLAGYCPAMRNRLFGAIVLGLLGALLVLMFPAAAGAAITQCLTQPFNPPTPSNPPNPGICAPGSPQIVAVSSTPPILGGPSERPGGDILATTSSGAVFIDGNSVPGLGNQPLAAPIVGITGSTNQYNLAAGDGGVFALPPGSLFYGSMGGHRLNAPIVGIADDGLDTTSYWLVAADGGVFAFRGAPFFGSMGGHPLNAPIVGMVPTFDGLGYWLVASDGGVFAFGDAGFYGSMGGQHLNAPIVGIAQTTFGFTSTGYFLAGEDGGVFAFGSAVFNGSGVGLAQGSVVGITTTDVAPGTYPPAWEAELATKTGQLLRLH